MNCSCLDDRCIKPVVLYVDCYFVLDVMSKKQFFDVQA